MADESESKRKLQLPRRKDVGLGD